MTQLNNFTKTLGFKIFMILSLGLLLLIPMEFISWLVRDRKSYQKDAIDSIVAPIGGVLTIEGTVIAVPYNIITVDTNGIKKISKQYIVMMPDTYNVNGDIDVKTLNRGIFKVPVFSSDINLDGSFKSYNSSLYNIRNEDILWDEAVLVLGISSKKNLTKLPKVYVNNSAISTYEKSMQIPIEFFHNTLYFKISKENVVNGFDFKLLASIQGGNSINILPLTSENIFTLSSKWQDPSFSGGFLPTERTITKDGFSARWDIASFNTSFNKSWTTADNEYRNRDYSSSSRKYYSETTENDFDTVSTSFLLLNDNYQKTIRSLKYKLLFIFIPFFALFLCEVLVKKRIHPVQYAFIGLANAIFYLLLLSISEHLNFNLSYFFSALLVTVMASLYSGYIMKSIKLGLAMSVVQVLVYTFLFGILQLTDYALLMGVIGLFIALAAAMYFTRNIDWYGENA